MRDSNLEAFFIERPLAASFLYNRSAGSANDTFDYHKILVLYGLRNKFRSERKKCYRK